MPLLRSELAARLAELARSPPANREDCAHAWAEALGAFTQRVLPPSTTVRSATRTLEAALRAAFASAAAAPGMENAFGAFAGAVATGMAPLYLGTPPSGPVGFARAFAAAKPETHEAAGESLARLIEAWLRRGAATAALGGATLPWS